MTTFLYRILEGIPDRLTEFRDIVKYASSTMENDPTLYNILCRSGCVLAVSTLEAFLKDLHDAIQSDLNSNIESFDGMPAGMKREFSRKVVYFDGVPEKDINKRINQLIRFFSANSVAIDMSAFQYKESVNRNPSSSFVDTAFSRYGINSILHCLAGTKFEAVFDNDSSTDLLLKRQIRRMRSLTFQFPYKDLPADFTRDDWQPTKGSTVPVSIWHTFVEQLARRRHGIVHADVRGNPTSWETLRSDGEKLEVLFSGLALEAASLIGSDLKLG